MQKLLAKTKLFADAHLSKLSGNNQRVMFYCNVANILYAHAIMVYAAAEKDPRLFGDLTGGSVRPSEVVQAAIFGRVGYHIGELGLVRYGLTTPLWSTHLLTLSPFLSGPVAVLTFITPSCDVAFNPQALGTACLLSLFGQGYVRDTTSLHTSVHANAI